MSRCYLVAAATFALSCGAAWAIQALFAASSLIGLIAVGLAWAIVIVVPTFFLLLARNERTWLIDLAVSSAKRAYGAQKR